MTTKHAKVLADITEARRAIQRIRAALYNDPERLPVADRIYDYLFDLESSLTTAEKPKPKTDIPMDAYAAPDAARYKAVMRKKT